MANYVLVPPSFEALNPAFQVLIVILKAVLLGFLLWRVAFGKKPISVEVQSLSAAV